MDCAFEKITRRSFLKTAALGGWALTTGCAAPGVLWKRRGPAGRKLRIIFYTDVHARTEWETPLALQQAADAINARKPDLVIAGGDLITDGFQSSAALVEPRWQAYLKMHKAINVPVQPVMGNHDLVAAIPEDGTLPAENPRRIFLETFGLKKTFRSFDKGGYHFIMLDSVTISGGKMKYRGMIPAGQMKWLKQDIAGLSEDTPVILVTHIPLLTSFYQVTRGPAAPAPENRVIVNSREVLSLFSKRNLLLVLQGHIHVKEMIKFSGTTFITGGAVCARWWRGPWFGTEEGFNMITLDDNKVKWEYIDYGWQARRPMHL